MSYRRKKHAHVLLIITIILFISININNVSTIISSRAERNEISLKSLNNDDSNCSEVSGSISGTLQGNYIKTEHFEMPAIESESQFLIPEIIKYIEIGIWYPSFVINFGDLFNNVYGKNNPIIIPRLDPNLHFFYKNGDDQLKIIALSDGLFRNGPHKKCFFYVNRPGVAKVGLINIKSDISNEMEFEKVPGNFNIETYGGWIDIMKNIFNGISLQVDVTMFSGIEISLPASPKNYCRNATFRLSWMDDNVTLSFSLIGANGEEIASPKNKSLNPQKIHLDYLFGCSNDDKYTFAVYPYFNDFESSIDFTIEYSWFV